MNATAAVIYLGCVQQAALAQGTTPLTRWVNGTQVNLRAEPSPKSDALTRLALNTRVIMIRSVPDSAYCEVSIDDESKTPQRGFTACQYLAMAPVSIEKMAAEYTADGNPNPQYDPARVFWLKPSWAAFEGYGAFLKRSKAPKAEPDAPRPADPEFERMKAHLAKGIFGDQPSPYEQWDALKQKAAAVLTDWASAKPSNQAVVVAQNLSMSLDLVGPAFETKWNPINRSVGLINEMELPAVGPSLFKRQSDVAPPTRSTQALSGHFHIVHTYQTKGRKRPEVGGWVDGTWDVGAYTTALTQPLHRTTIFRDGQLRDQITHVNETTIVWGKENDSKGCEGVTDGFASGDSDLSIWQGYFGMKEKPPLDNPPGSLLYVYTRDPLPLSKTTPHITKLKLDREKTGFVRATQMHFDLDGDGVFDIAVWEGAGIGPGHLNGPTKTDDAYQRLFFVNIAGQWHLLGSDSFIYGCGC